MSTVAGFVNSCPSGVSTVNVTQVSVEYGGAGMTFHSELFNFAQMTHVNGLWYVELTRWPVHPDSVSVFYNSGAQRPYPGLAGEYDFQIVGNTVLLNFAPTNPSVLMVNYAAYATSAAGDGTIPTGTVVAYNDAAPVPAGWCLCDGIAHAEYLITSYPALYTFAEANGLLSTAVGVTPFAIRELKSIKREAGALVELLSIIKA